MNRAEMNEDLKRIYDKSLAAKKQARKNAIAGLSVPELPMLEALAELEEVEA